MAIVRQTARLAPRRIPRTPAHAPHRFASSSAPGGGADAQKKAQDALASAQKYWGEAVKTGKRLLGPVGERLGGMLGAYRQPLVYNAAVAREFLKQVYVTERLQPPSLSTFLDVYATLWARAKNPAYWRELVQSGEWTKVGLYAVEAYGIFKVGEIIGRRSLIGYNVQ
ncbi:hypothetical protein OBBRIDRAFT_721909 [Obba rivulosa]|uniref:Uncharacterized protein n=1 Tax=Obba rivulosa TaxID=1052685 RepID=A0A8E2DS76_9APHY|nr:hypothetical protein OBBRIDRAFT_721909 [Obba rivulosa]